MCHVDTATKVGQYSPPKSSEPKSTTQEPAPPTAVADKSGDTKSNGVKQAKTGVLGANGGDDKGAGGANAAAAGVGEIMPQLVEVLSQLVEVLKSLVEALMDSTSGKGGVGGKSGGEDPTQKDPVQNDPAQKDKGGSVGGENGDEEPVPPAADEDPVKGDPTQNGKDGKSTVGGENGDEEPAPPPADEDPVKGDPTQKDKGGSVGGENGDENPAPPPADDPAQTDPTQTDPTQTDPTQTGGKEGPATGSVLLEDWDDKKSGGATGSKGVALTAEDGLKVVIWGDPHVIITEAGGKGSEKFDIGYGPGRVELSTGTVVRWDTSTKADNGADHIMRNIWIEQAGGESFSASTYDGTSHTGENGQVTTMTDAELHEFAEALRAGKGPWKEPLHSSLADAQAGVDLLEPANEEAIAA